MATSSIFSNIKVTDKRFCKSLVKVLEDARETTSKEVVFSKSFKELNAKQLIDVFGSKNNDRV